MPKNILPKTTSRNPGVYKLVFKDNTVYVGSTNNIRNRAVKHLVMLRGNKHYSQKLTEAYHKNGLFEVEVLEECALEELKKREQHYIDILNPSLNLYRTTIGSTSTINSLQSLRERMQRPEMKEKISKSISVMHANMTNEERTARGKAIAEGKARTPCEQKNAAKAAQKLKVSQPVISDCGKSFVSKAAAAEHLGVTKSAVCQAMKNERAIGGMMLRNIAGKR